MAVFTVMGDVDPLLHVQLQQGESVYAESDAMVMAEDTLDVEGSLGNSGLLGAIMRRVTQEESFFLQRIIASRGSGDLLLAHAIPGGVHVLDVGPSQYLLTDGAFLACSEQVTLESAMQGVGNALFGGTGGFMIMRTAGNGQVAVAGFGSTFLMDIEPGRPVTIDNDHLVAWDSQIHYEVAVSTTKRGFLREMFSAATTGEALVLKLSGRGKILICSRNKKSFLQWMAAETRTQEKSS
ncbi:MAG: TIGR00266 family protein [Magnetococcales bacterium]|nr:TIGR00266 family protein [Magnetococcales bacterium]